MIFRVMRLVLPFGEIVNKTKKDKFCIENTFSTLLSIWLHKF